MTTLFEYEPPPKPTGRQLADAGMALASEHADAVEEGWSERAYGWLVQYRWVALRFMAEDVRRYAEKMGLSSPPDPRAWGGVMQRASRAKLIVKDGYGESLSTQAHCRPTQFWKFNQGA